ncbi:hypothetical protein [Rhodococcus sp. JS3073]|uniref:hypothetical protein n=1 Tax=Rhodococcus sp. JS3073 TaxID=3002901 RepID=UPI0022866646|nr:hypothetical protein [Rhodococcus sp. JS3073]WAM17509.1 hypothetical protein OYT95_13090 [Rhodococcus sp. JS3073]
MASTQDVKGLVSTVRALGAELPLDLSQTAQLLLEVEAARPVRDEVRHAAVQAAAFAPGATTESVLEAVELQAEAGAGAAFSSRLLELAQAALVTRFAQELRGPSGDALLVGLRTGFDARVAAPFASANRLGIVGLSAEAILANGTEAQAEAWRALPAAAQYGDRVYQLVVGLVGAFNVVTSGEYGPRAAAASFFAHNAHDFTTTAVGFARGGGVWSSGRGQLNTVSEAQAILDDAAPQARPERENTTRVAVNTLHAGGDDDEQEVGI